MTVDAKQRAGHTKREASRAALLDAACNMVRRDGWDAKVGDIAASAGVSTATLYNVWPSKPDIITAAFEAAIISELFKAVDSLSGSALRRNRRAIGPLFERTVTNILGGNVQLVRAALIARLVSLGDEHDCVPRMVSVLGYLSRSIGATTAPQSAINASDAVHKAVLESLDAAATNKKPAVVVGLRSFIDACQAVE